MFSSLFASSARLPDKPLNPQSDLCSVTLCSENKHFVNIVELERAGDLKLDKPGLKSWLHPLGTM